MKRTVWVNAYKEMNHNTQLYNTKADAIENRDRLAGWLGAFPCEIDVPECNHAFAEPICVEIMGWIHQCEKCKKWFACEPPEPKQTVTIEAGWIGAPQLTESGNRIINCYVPPNAKNVHCTYEVDK